MKKSQKQENRVKQTYAIVAFCNMLLLVYSFLSQPLCYAPVARAMTIYFLIMTVYWLFYYFKKKVDSNISKQKRVIILTSPVWGAAMMLAIFKFARIFNL